MNLPTPTPWYLKREGRFQSIQVWSSIRGGEICIAVDLHPANGELIVKAVNAHDPLVAALRKICDAKDGIAVINAVAEARALIKEEA